MATTVATPVLTWNASLHSGSGVAAGSSLSVVIFLSGNWEARVPVRVFYASQVSADIVVNVYPSMDGVHYDTIPMFSFSIARTATAAVQQSFIITGPGTYEILVTTTNVARLNSIAILTHQILTAYIGV